MFSLEYQLQKISFRFFSWIRNCSATEGSNQLVRLVIKLNRTVLAYWKFVHHHEPVLAPPMITSITCSAGMGINSAAVHSELAICMSRHRQNGTAYQIPKDYKTGGKINAPHA
jgi:hypothetical protein